MKVQYKNVCSIRQAEVEFPLGTLVSIRGETNAGKSALFYGLLAGFTNSPEFKKFINIDALKEDPKAFEWIGIFDEDGNQFQVEAGTNYLYYRTNDAKYEKVGRKNIFELMEKQIPGLLYDPEDTRQIMNIQGEDDGFFPIDRTDSQIFKTYERLLSLSNTSDILTAIKLDIEDLDVKMSDALSTVQQYTKKSAKIDKLFEMFNEDELNESLKVLEVLSNFYDDAIQSYDKTKKTAEYVKALASKPKVQQYTFDLEKFRQMLTDVLSATQSIKYKELCAVAFKKEDFDVQGAIQIGQDFSVAQMLVQDINELSKSMNNDIAALQEISNILDSIKVCPLCGKPMEECND